MEVTLNDTACGVRPWPPYAVFLGEAARAGENELSILVTNTAGNEMYHDTQYDTGIKAKSGIVGPVTLKPYRVFEVRITK